MLIPSVLQTEADKLFVNVYNSQGSAVTNGDALVWNTSSPDGVKTTQPLTATLALFVGLAVGTIGAGAYGLAQAYGFMDSAALVTNNTATAIAAGQNLIPVDQADYLDALNIASTGLQYGFVYAAEEVATNATPAAAAFDVFVRAI
jgi:hypothetical protein